MRPVIKSKPKIGGREITDQQWTTLKEGGFIYLENMTSSKGQLYSAYVIIDDKHQQAFMFKNRPDEFVKYGQYEMRAMDKRLIEAGYLVKATVKWYGMNNFAHPYLWKPDAANDEAVRQLTGYEIEENSDYCQSWGDPRKKATSPTLTTTSISPSVGQTASDTVNLLGDVVANFGTSVVNTLTDAGATLGGLLDITPNNPVDDPGQEQYIKRKKTKKKRGMQL